MIDDMDWFVKFIDSVNIDESRKYEVPFSGNSLLCTNTFFRKHYLVKVKSVFFNILENEWYCEVDVYLKEVSKKEGLDQYFTTADNFRYNKFKSMEGKKLNQDGYCMSINYLCSYERERYNIIDIEYGEGVQKRNI